MDSEKQIVFGIFRLDLLNECLWRDGKAIALAPKEFAVLLHLARHADKLVTKEELIEAAWPETSVTDGILKVRIRKIRAAMGDDASAPRFIETAHRRGYRFISTIDEASPFEPHGSPAAETPGPGTASPLGLPVSLPAGIVGRDAAPAARRGRLKSEEKRRVAG